MNLSRRLFLGGALSLVGATQVAALDTMPVVYADGVRDDGPGLNAWLRGEPVRLNGEKFAVYGGKFEIVGANLRTSETIFVNAPIYMFSCDIRALPDFRGDSMIHVNKGGSGSIFNSCYFDSRNVGRAPAWTQGWKILDAA